MKRSGAFLCLYLFLNTSSILIFPQTQLFRNGNAACYFADTGMDQLEITTGTTEINGKIYFVRKICTPWYSPGFTLRYDRIEGDSVSYVLTEANTDSLLFNFNWKEGTITYSDTVSHFIYSDRIDSIRIMDYWLPQDTVYFTGHYTIDIISGDTSHSIPEVTAFSKKFGSWNRGLWIVLQGAKIDGVRYGDIAPFPEEIYFSPDSLISDSARVSFYIINSSDYNVKLNSTHTLGKDFSPCFMTEITTDSGYYNFQLCNFYEYYPPVNISAHDSVFINIYDIYIGLVKEYFYFTDTLFYNMQFSGPHNYLTERLVPISGYGIIYGDVNDSAFIPAGTELLQNYPNPFNPETSIKFSIDHKLYIQLKIFDLLGREIKSIVDEERQPGIYTEVFSGNDFPSGVYLCRLMAGKHSLSKKILLLK